MEFIELSAHVNFVVVLSFRTDGGRKRHHDCFTHFCKIKKVKTTPDLFSAIARTFILQETVSGRIKFPVTDIILIDQFLTCGEGRFHRRCELVAIADKSAIAILVFIIIPGCPAGSHHFIFAPIPPALGPTISPSFEDLSCNPPVHTGTDLFQIRTVTLDPRFFKTSTHLICFW
jgi:hypothetical protein